MSHTVCGTGTTVTTNGGKLVVVGPLLPTYKWSTSVESSMVKEDGYSSVDTVGDVIFRWSTDPFSYMTQMNGLYAGYGTIDDFRNVAYTYNVWNGHPCMSDAGQVCNGVHTQYGICVDGGYKTVFVAYRITGTPAPNQPLFSLGAFCMRILPDDTTKVGSDTMSPPVEVPLGTNGTVCVLGIQFALSGSDTDFAYIGTDDASVTRVQNVWFTGSTPAGPDDVQQLILGFWPQYPDYRSPAMEWYEVRYYAMNTLTDQDMIKIRNEMKAQFA